MLLHTKRQVLKMLVFLKDAFFHLDSYRSSLCLFLQKLKWPKNKSVN